MSEYQNHIRKTLEGQHEDPSEDLGMDAMRWAPAPVGDDVPDEASTAAEAAHALLDRAADAYLSLLDSVLGDGTHHIVASASSPHGELSQGQQLTVIGDAVIINQAEALRLCTVLAAGMVGSATCGLVVRTFAPDGSESVRGWTVRNFWLRPLTADKIRQAYSVDPVTGAPLPPEPGVEYRQAERVPRPQAETQPGSRSRSRTAPQDNRPTNRRN
ncbi:hypothetical protein QWJ26_30055 [Streptomyces sp. CSDS2]|uniref:hypothetical protein n=1 Tax=Streptomyces sp. CSDS2 TaxID=3055051 RepID=UPI0025B24C21|nr:hypothetical protein [Streptomyces sp. CSDS2]MDN3263981.1 hypothetical protein [Streptomyces sp. CSDS2]